MKGANVGTFEGRQTRQVVKPLTAVSRLKISTDYHENATSKLKYDAFSTAEHNSKYHYSAPFSIEYCRRKSLSSIPPLKAEKLSADKNYNGVLEKTVSFCDKYSRSQYKTTERVNFSQPMRGSTKKSVSTALRTDIKQNRDLNTRESLRTNLVLPRHCKNNYTNESGKLQTQRLCQKGKITRNSGQHDILHQKSLSQTREINDVPDVHAGRMVAENCGRLGSIGYTEKCVRWLQGL